MTRNLKKSLAFLLVLVQLFMLMPVLQPQVKATDTETEEDPPALNRVIEGTVRFGSFNYSGDKGEGTSNDGDERDGVDYVSTFYYTDDYFSRSAINPKAQTATTKTMEWTELEDLSMATLSKNFTVAVYGSSENTFPTDWNNKDKNGKRFLTDCGFSNLFTSSEFNGPTGKDTLGYMFGSKQITVYDQKTQQNKTFTLVAVGVRGGGYGAEWASNLTIGNSNGAAGQNSNNSLKYRHYGFDYNAQRVLSDLREYTKNMTGDLKYWVVGYSRAGAIANLVAGDITTNASQYKTTMDDVYGYTFEAACGALKSDEAATGTNFPNIHNIINPMDAVPLVSPPEFNHCRLGMDYRLPFHGNVSDAQNITYYSRMRAVLPLVAALAPLYNKNVSNNDKDKTEDTIVTDSAPDKYPYRSTIQMKSFGIMAYNNGFVNDVSNSKIAPSGGWYMDEFLKSFVTKFFSSRAWDASKLRETFTTILWQKVHTGWNADDMHRDDHASHEYEYVKYYQEALRTLAYEALKNPGMGLSALDGIMDNAMSTLKFEDYLNGAGILFSYGVMDGSGGGWGYESSVGDMISPMASLINSIIDGIGLFDSSALPSIHDAITAITPVLTWLYCDDHTFCNGEYLGTVFANVGTILVTHAPELSVSWLMSLDDVFISDYREITLPKNTAVSMKVLREGIDYTDESELQFLKENGAKNADVPGVEVAAFVHGTKTLSKDDRITVTESGDNFTIRYPGTMDVRFEVTAADERFDDISLNLSDWTPGTNVVNAKSTCIRAGKNDDEGLNEGNIKTVSIDHAMTTQDDTPDAQHINGLVDANGSITVPLSGTDTLNIMSWHGSNQVVGQKDTTYYVSLDKAPRSVVAEYTMQTVLADNVMEQPEDLNEQFTVTEEHQLVWTGNPTSESKTYAKTGARSFTAFDLSALGNAQASKVESVVDAGYYSTRQSVTVVPAANIYYDDTLLDSTKKVDASVSAPNYENTIKTITSTGTPVTTDNLAAFKFTGTRIDLYMNTTSSDQFVSAYILDADGNLYVQDGVKTSMLITGKSTNNLTNVPVISFTGLRRGTYTLAVIAPSRSSYTLDGVRVYDESKASYASVRETLLGLEDWKGDTTVSGTVYLDYNNNGNATRNNYETAGPKGEVYLKNGNGVAFTIDGYSASANYRIGMSAVNGTAVNVDINGEPYTVSATTHMFYDLHPTATGNVVIRVTGGNGILSVTDVEEVLPALTGSRRLSFSASPELMLFAKSLSVIPEETPVPEETAAPVETAAPEETADPAEDPVVTPTPEPTPSPTPVTTPTPKPTPDIAQLVSDFMRSLFGGFGRLFRP